MANDWRSFDLGATAWYNTRTQSDAAQLVSRITGTLDDPQQLPDLDIRPGGIRVRVRSDVELVTESVSAIAGELGLTADPAALQELQVTLDALNPAVVTPFWVGALGYQLQDRNKLTDPVRRDPPIRVGPMQTPRPLRDRIHLDISRPGEGLITAAIAAGGRHLVRPDGNGPYSDPEGNEADLVPGWSLGDDPDYADWDVVFGAMVGYRVDTPAVAAGLITAVTRLTDLVDMPLLIDYRPDRQLVIIDTAKDGWEDERFADLARGIQSAARHLGLGRDPSALRFVQFGIAVADVTALREFWRATLGYVDDPRPVTDIDDPRRLNPPLFFQQIDTTETERLTQRNRLHFDLVVPGDQLLSRVDAALAAGGVVGHDDRPHRCTIVDPEGNVLEIVAGGHPSTEP